MQQLVHSPRQAPCFQPGGPSRHAGAAPVGPGVATLVDVLSHGHLGPLIAQLCGEPAVFAMRCVSRGTREACAAWRLPPTLAQVLATAGSSVLQHLGSAERSSALHALRGVSRATRAAASRHIRRAEWLYTWPVTNTPYQEELADAAAGAHVVATLPSLRELRLADALLHELNGRRVAALAAAELPPNVTCLDASGVALLARGAAKLAAVQFGGTTAAPRDVSLRSCLIGDKGLAALLLRARWLRSVQALDLGGNRLSPNGAAMLHGRWRPGPPPLPALARLSLAGNEGLGAKGASQVGAAIADGRLPRLQALDMSGCGLGPGGLRALFAPALEQQQQQQQQQQQEEEEEEDRRQQVLQRAPCHHHHQQQPGEQRRHEPFAGLRELRLADNGLPLPRDSESSGSGASVLTRVTMPVLATLDLARNAWPPSACAELRAAFPGLRDLRL